MVPLHSMLGLAVNWEGDAIAYIYNWSAIKLGLLGERKTRLRDENGEITSGDIIYLLKSICYLKLLIPGTSRFETKFYYFTVEGVIWISGLLLRVLIRT